MVSGYDFIKIVNDLYDGHGTSQFDGIFSIRSAEVREYTKHIQILLHPKQFGTIRKEPVEVFTIEYHSDNEPEVIRFRPGEWVGKIISIHRTEMERRAAIQRDKEEQKSREYQENLAYELSAFLPIDDRFLLD